MTQCASPRTGVDDIRRGFVWLGAASVVARVLDGATVLVVMWLVTREQIGLATLAWSVAVFLEAMNGLGLSTALLQSKSNSTEQLSAAFYYTMGLATALIATTAALSPFVASWFGAPELGPMLIVASTKLWLVGAALVPLNQLNRNTRFDRIAVVSTAATLLAGITTCTLAALGAQAWALVLGQVAHGLFTFIGAQLAHPFRPRGRPRFAPIRREAVFGAKIATASLVYHFYRNADYYLVARWLGVSAVGVYRVAFDLAMTPTLSVLTVVTRSALPVYARLGDRPAELVEAFLWTLRNLLLLLAPVTALLWFGTDGLLAWFDGGKWHEAAPIVRVLALAALMRCAAETFATLFSALRRPELALYNSLLTMVILLVLLASGLQLWGQTLGPVVAAWAWAALYPCALAWLTWMTAQLVPLRLTKLSYAMKPWVGALFAMGAGQLLFALLLEPSLPTSVRAVVDVAVLLGCFVLYLRLVLGMELRPLLTRAPASAREELRDDDARRVATSALERTGA